MSGRTDFLLIAVCSVSVIAMFTDLVMGKIYNWLTFPSLCLALYAGFQFGGPAGLNSAIVGMLAGFAIYGWMYFIGKMGAGDVKLLMSLGALGGWKYALDVGVLSIFLGGLLAAIMLASKGNLRAFGRKIYRFVLTAFHRELEVEMPKLDSKQTMPYGVPMGIAAIVTVLYSPLERWGLRLW